MQRFSAQPSAVLTIEPTRETEESSPPADPPANTAAGERDDSPITEPLLGNEVQPEQQITGPTSSDSNQHKDELDRKMDFAYNISLIVNVALFAAKIYAFAVSHSKSVLASCADSLVDIASQLVLALADHKVAKADPKFPVGRTRLEAVGESQLLGNPLKHCICLVQTVKASCINHLWTMLLLQPAPELNTYGHGLAVLMLCRGCQLCCHHEPVHH